MHSVLVIFLLGFVAKAQAGELTINGSVDAQTSTELALNVQTSVDKLADKLSDRSLQTSRLQAGNLDGATVRKPGHVATASRLRPVHSLANLGSEPDESVSMRSSQEAAPIQRPPAQAITLLSKLVGLTFALAVALGGGNDAYAELSAPNRNIPRSGEIALRRAVPSRSREMTDVQVKIEDIFTKLRTPQRKAWDAMQTDVAASMQVIKVNPDKIVGLVPTKDKAEATALVERLEIELAKITEAINYVDPDATGSRVAQALKTISIIECLQQPDLPYTLPKQYAELPRLTGRATAEVVVKRPNGQFENLQGGSQSEATLQLVLDGYNAPLTAGRFVQNVKRGVFSNVPIEKGGSAVFAKGDITKGSAAQLPLEFKIKEDIEPRYRLPIDAQGGDETPTLPMSVPGAVAMSKGEVFGTSDPNTFFFYLFNRAQAGLGGIAFEEGEYSVFAYVVNGQDVLEKLRTGDILKSVTMTSGSDRLSEYTAPSPTTK